MIVKRIATFATVLLLTSACSCLPIGPTAYSSLPPQTMPSVAAPVAQAPVVSGEVDAAPLPVIIPGTLKTPEIAITHHGVNPTDVLEASTRSRVAWKPLRSADLLKPPAFAGRSLQVASQDVTETASTSATERSAVDKRGPATIAVPTYNREATMDRLVKGGRDAAKAICSGC